jgi:hypothetical protein
MLKLFDAAARVSVGVALCFLPCRTAFAQALAPLDSPAGPGSGEPNLAVAPDGRVILSWIEAVGDGAHALRMAARTPGASWSAAREVTRGTGFFVNWADFPSVATHPDGSLWAHWLVKSGDSKYAYDVKISRSADGGKTWSAPLTPHRDGTQAEHGFVSLLPFEQSMGVVWLDGRKMAGGHGHDSKTAETQLMFTTIDRQGKLADEVVLDPRVCDCCQTAAVPTSAGAVVAYRDRSPAELRDISAVRFDEAGWSAPADVSGDGWKIEGCPVNGPALAASGSDVALAWYASPPAGMRALVAFSRDGGRSFGSPIQFDEGRPLGRVGVVLLADGSALVSWLERRGEAAQVLARRIEASGAKGPLIVVADTTPARSSGFSRLVRSGGEVVFAWTEDVKPPRVRTAVLKLEPAK